MNKKKEKSSLLDPSCLACGGELIGRPVLNGQDYSCSTPGSFQIYECSVCGSGTTLPLVNNEELHNFYPKDYDVYAEQKKLREIINQLLQRFRMNTGSLAEISKIEPGSALDIGCGRGNLGAALIKKGWRVSGIEPDQTAAAVARMRGIDVKEGVVESVFWPDQTFDLIIFHHCLEHVTNPKRDLQKAWNMLRPGGKLIIVLPNWNSWQRKLFGPKWSALDLPRHRTHFTAKGLRLAACGTGQVRIQTTSSLLVIIWSLQYVLLGRRAKASGISPFLWGALGVCLWPFVKLVDSLFGGDTLHLSARKDF